MELSGCDRGLKSFEDCLKESGNESRDLGFIKIQKILKGKFW